MDEQQAWSQMRNRAAARLSANFGQQVVTKAVQCRRARRQQARLAMVTALALIISVSVGSWWKARQEEQTQVAQWEQWMNFQQVALTSL